MPVRFEVPERGAEVLSAFFVEIDDKNGQATHCERILINKDHPFKG